MEDNLRLKQPQVPEIFRTRWASVITAMMRIFRGSGDLHASANCSAEPERFRRQRYASGSPLRGRGTRPALPPAGREKHQPSGSRYDTYRALNTIERLLGAVSAPQAVELAKVKGGLLRQRWGEQARKSNHPHRNPGEALKEPYNR